jgi:hypothetical protein
MEQFLQALLLVAAADLLLVMLPEIVETVGMADEGPEAADRARFKIVRGIVETAETEVMGLL